MTHGKAYNKSPRRINNKATKSRTNTGTSALEWPVEQTSGGFKALSQLADFTLGSDATLNTDGYFCRICVSMDGLGVKVSVHSFAPVLSFVTSASRHIGT